jgi:acetate kinase
MCEMAVERVSTEKAKRKDSQEKIRQKRLEAVKKAKSFFVGKETNVIDIFGEKIVVRPLNFYAKTIIDDTTVLYDEEKGIQVLAGTIKRIKLKHQIVSWSFKDEKGAIIPVNDDTLSNLDPFVAEEIYDEIERLYDTVSEEEKKELEGN